MKTAVVTGGSKGIGLGVASMLVGKGYRVIASYAHDDAAAQEAARRLGGNIIFCKADHSARSETYDFAQFVRQQAPDGIDCIICNAGTTVRKSFSETTDDDWDRMMEVAVNGHVILLRELFDIINDGSRIIFTGSAMGCHPHATVLGYGVTKGAVHALVKNLVKVFESKKTTVNAVAPGFVDTEWQKDKPEEIRRNICNKTAIHRFASIDETVSAYAFCLDNAYVNGSVIEIHGGYSYK
ncbi:MAG: SDR family NAD(P)-dependent oxidoreductase [Prevotella sp.]